MNKKNIIFDLGGVLVDLNRDRCMNNFKALGFHNIDELIDPFEQEGIFMQLEKGIITAKEFREKIREELNQPLTDAQIDDAWNSFLVGFPSYKLDLLLELRSQYKLYLLSNTNEIHWEWCKEHGFAYKGYNENNFFEKIFLSFEMQKTKPSAAIFQTVLNETDIIPGETFFIDDSPANCETAEILGIATYTPKPGEDWSHLFH
ncbi:HAD family phosphatase [Bacteroides sp. 519]|uniref:HAD family hydrolase n=1 Tax=Bacteroides sp. 519 TaxID=2302937 RepID=UPI0013CFC019|nr:HAD family phosphatase [Bacteroides sp. 519]NDV57658.1 HAD family phosphatase [Bacteroides sp. 519]